MQQTQECREESRLDIAACDRPSPGIRHACAGKSLVDAYRKAVETKDAKH
jgi:hypothetical protein